MDVVDVVGGGNCLFTTVSLQLKQIMKARLHERKNWNGSCKKSNASDKVLRVNDIWPVPVLPVPFKKGSIGAYGPFSELNG